MAIAIAPSGTLTFTAAPPGSINTGASFGFSVQLRFRGGTLKLAAGVPVLVLVQAGAASLSGTTEVATDSVGLATFSGLALNGSGAVTLRIQAPGHQVLTQAITVNAGGGAFNFPNRPGGLTTRTDWPWNVTLPAGSGDTNLGSGWGCIDGGSYLIRTDDPTAPHTPQSVAQFTYQQGSWGGGIPGQGSSTGWGTLYYSNTPAASTVLYAMIPQYLGPTWQRHGISDKGFKWEPGNILCQLSHNDHNISMYIGVTDTVYDCNIFEPSYADLRNRYIFWEWLVRRHATQGSLELWMTPADTLVTQLCARYLNINVPNPGGFNDWNINSTQGGGGGNNPSDMIRRIDHTLLASA